MVVTSSSFYLAFDRTIPHLSMTHDLRSRPSSPVHATHSAFSFSLFLFVFLAFFLIFPSYRFLFFLFKSSCPVQHLILLPWAGFSALCHGHQRNHHPLALWDPLPPFPPNHGHLFVTLPAGLFPCRPRQRIVGRHVTQPWMRGIKCNLYTLVAKRPPDLVAHASCQRPLLADVVIAIARRWVSRIVGAFIYFLIYIYILFWPQYPCR